MKGARPLSSKELDDIRIECKSLRDRVLIELGICTGARISELLSLNWGDVLTRRNKISSEIYFPRHTVKGKTEGRTARVPASVRNLLERHLAVSANNGYPVERKDPIFVSRKFNNRLGLRGASRAFKVLCWKAGLEGNVSTHSLRKTFALIAYRASGKDLLVVSRLLGHLDVATTTKYLDTCRETVELVNGALEEFLK